MKMKFSLFTFFAAAIVLFGGTGCSDDSTKDDGGGGEPGGGDEPAQTVGPFNVEISDITFYSAHLACTPDDETVTYYDHIVPKASFVKNWDSDVSKFMSEYVAYLCEANNQSPEDVVADMLTTGFDEWDYIELEPGTEYVAFAVGLDAAGTLTTAPTVEEFTSTAADALEIVACRFNIDVSNITYTSADIIVMPSNKQIPYYYGIFPAEEYEQTKDKNELLYDQVRWDIINLMYDEGLSFEEAIERTAYLGDAGGSLQEGALRPGTKYVVVAFGFDKYARPNTDITVGRFQTTAVTPSSNTFAITLESKSAIDVVYKIETTNDDPYFTGIYTKEMLAGLSDDEIVALLEERSEIYGGYNGSDSFSGNGRLFADTDYEIIALGYDMAATTPITRLEFSTEAGGNPADCRFEFEFIPEAFKATLNVQASDETVFYHYDLIPVEEYTTDEELTSEFEEYLKQASAEMGATISEAVLNMCYRGEAGDIYATESLKKYYAVAYAVNIDGTPGGKVQKQEVQAAERKISSANVTITHSKFYNGADLYALDPDKYVGGVNWDGVPLAYMPCTITPNADAKTWYVGVFYSDIMTMSDAGIIQNLIEYAGGEKDPIQLSRCWFNFFDVSYYGESGMTSAICAVAIDANGDYSAIYKEEVKLLTTGVSPISEITGGTDNVSKQGPARVKQPQKEDLRPGLRPLGNKSGSEMNRNPSAATNLGQASASEKAAAKSAAAPKKDQLRRFDFGSGRTAQRF